MQSHREALAATPTYFKLKTGEQFLARPLTEKDNCELEDWVRRQYLSNTRRALQGMPAAEREEFMRLALDECQKLSIRYGIGQTWLVETIKGLVRLSFQFIKKDTSLTEEEWSNKFFPEGIVDQEHLDEFNFVMQHLTPKIPEEVEEKVLKDIDPLDEIREKKV
jgi:hypothetical protein